MISFDSLFSKPQDLFNNEDLVNIDDVHNITMYAFNDIHIVLPLWEEHDVKDNPTFSFKRWTIITILGKHFPCLQIGNINDSLPFFTEKDAKTIHELINKLVHDVDSLVWDVDNGLMVSEDETL